MTERGRKLRRIVAVQQKLHRLEEYRLADLRRRSDELRRDEESLVAALNDDQAFAGLFVDAMASHLGRLGREAVRVADAEEKQSARVRDAALRLKRTERFTRRAATDERREDEKHALKELLERLPVGRGDASLV